MGGHPGAARRAFLRAAARAGVHVREQCGVSEVREGQLVLQDGGVAPFDACLWCTQARAAPWISQCGLPTGAPPAM